MLTFLQISCTSTSPLLPVMVCPLFPLAPKCHRLWQGCLCHTRDPAAELPVAMKTQHSAVSAELLQHSSRHPLKCSWCVSQEPDWADPILWERTHIVAQQWVCWEETLAVARFQQAVTLCAETKFSWLQPSLVWALGAC